MCIAQKVQALTSSLPDRVTLVAVSKFHPVESIREAYDAGQRVFGESRVQELKAKQPALPDDIEWHFIGTLQRNKVKDIAPFIHTIHSLDSIKLLEEVHKQAAKHERVIRLLLEIHVAQEETKQGLTPEECMELLAHWKQGEYPFIRITGIMGMATDTEDETLIRKEFRTLHQVFCDIKQQFFKDDDSFQEISMGMSHDYPIAVEEGSTLIRVGTFIFGQRKY
ncbi:pyridoxal phosphate enzyme (YggS family) [Parabacteroides sp. PFB2-10]|uniref:YggS family pyridoxal phosphate-dependent enzyme n=1 Tax=Parabacteroides sp. PFB2-10 TaxID=1742405 RepID=UPI002474AACD|nr:YggS family pyridoxal phosphate-dependent enzyme [Parabacteroides sp. PFB2-10]MDH6313734.1 pyridoxal phosphate enzyme (YggS family) [Parabacteroides sp. PFB2-10]